ncbi:MAG: hypothetical protein QOF78_3575 [Phycisphaerales bacterium]|nr:hypothetical protein [Phycisphaerales bacterium]
MQAFNDWLHCNGSTYGTWLRGDPRGWRSRRHREDCDGDYKHPPPKGKFDKEFKQSKDSMKREGVELSVAARRVACRAMVQALQFHHVEVLALCVGKKGWHALIRCPKKTRDGKTIEQMLKSHAEKSLGIAIPRLWRNRIARHFTGLAKKESARALSREGLAEPGGIWAGGCGVKPIKDRTHQTRAVKYIRDHVLQGAFVWLWLQELP